MTCTVNRFLSDVAGHKLTVLRDEGVYRHLRFNDPAQGGVMAFDLLTWPGRLCYTGDMGTYVFARTNDMFKFFRRESVDKANLDYWSEKVVAKDRDGVEQYSEVVARQVIEEWMNDVEASPELRAAVEDEILPKSCDGEDIFRSAVNDFEHDGWSFSDFYETRLTEYAYRFRWCCFALVWGILKYDDHREQLAREVAK